MFDGDAGRLYRRRRTRSCSKSTSRAMITVRYFPPLLLGPATSDILRRRTIWTQSILTWWILVVRKTLPKFSERVLTSTKILSQRSAVSAVFSRANSSSASSATISEKRKAVTHEDKSRLLRMGKKLRRGPFNAYVDPDQVGEGSAMLELTEAAKKAGTYDVWAEEVPEKVPVKVCIVLFTITLACELMILMMVRLLAARYIGTTVATSSFADFARGRACTARGRII